MTSRIDDLVAGLATVRDGDITSEPDGAGGRSLLAAITAEDAPAPRRRRPRRLPGLVGAAVVVSAAAAAVAVLLPHGGRPVPLRSYANAAMSIQVKGTEYEVEVKDAYADQREFGKAFAKVGLDARLRIVPVTPEHEREIVQSGSLHAPKGGESTVGMLGMSDIVMKCPPGQSACPLRVRLSGSVYRLTGADIVIGRKAGPGEVFFDARPVRGDRAQGLRLAGRTVAEALAELRRRGLTSAFTLGDVNADGSGSSWASPLTWRPSGERRITGAWMRSSDSVGLMVVPQQGDPRPRPVD
ncbi:hypothetical protein [Actinomadura harenae]|uniref:Uncharacterized protein n=1 Tax=Actinomadura harenae TaxID=2483351 RepID=A0A3M2M750_9ACTN|nr:hypothetical protein [Actinomadura harenae]RMI42928.1 hypothetical protein EBO15_18055 [Actinomadura harenae]